MYFLKIHVNHFRLQANHGFGDKINAEFCYLTHPRFGNIRGMRSIRTIQKGKYG